MQQCLPKLLPRLTRRIICCVQMPDGKPANRYAFDAKALSADHAQKVVAETHEFYLRLKAGTQPNSDGGAVALVQRVW